MPPVAFTPGLQMQAVSLLVQDHSQLERNRDCFDHELFAHPSYSLLLKIILEYFDRYGCPPSRPTLQTITENECLRDAKLGEFQLDHLQAVDEVFCDLLPEEKQFIEINLEQILKDRLINKALTKAHTLEDYDEVVETVEKAAHWTMGATSDIGMTWSDFSRLEEYMAEDKVPPVPTGIAGIDNNMQGGARGGQLNVVVGFTGAGKSQVLINIGWGALNVGRRVWIYSFEMPSIDMFRRMDARTSGVDFWDMRKPDQNAIVRSYMTNFMAERPNAYLGVKFFPAKSAGVRHLHAHIKRISSEMPLPDLIIVDYGELLKASSTYTSKYDELGNTFEELKGLAQTWNIPIWTATQGTRQAMTAQVVSLQHVSDSLGKVRIADGVYCICRTEEERQRRIFRIFEAKSRGHEGGNTHYFRAHFQRSYMEEINLQNYETVMQMSIQDTRAATADNNYRGSLGATPITLQLPQNTFKLAIKDRVWRRNGN